MKKILYFLVLFLSLILLSSCKTGQANSLGIPPSLSENNVGLCWDNDRCPVGTCTDNWAINCECNRGEDSDRYDGYCYQTTREDCDPGHCRIVGGWARCFTFENLPHPPKPLPSSGVCPEGDIACVVKAPSPARHLCYDLNGYCGCTEEADRGALGIGDPNCPPSPS